MKAVLILLAVLLTLTAVHFTMKPANLESPRLHEIRAIYNEWRAEFGKANTNEYRFAIFAENYEWI